MAEALVKNAADESQVKGAERTEKRARDRELNDICSILDLPSGRRYIWKLLSRCGVYESSFDVSGSKMYFNEGQRNVGLTILADINEANPEVYVTMMKEAKGREANGE